MVATSQCAVYNLRIKTRMDEHPVTSVALEVSQMLRTVWTSRRHGALLGQNEVTHGSDERSAWWRWSCSRKLTHAVQPGRSARVTGTARSHSRHLRH